MTLLNQLAALLDIIKPDISYIVLQSTLGGSNCFFDYGLVVNDEHHGGYAPYEALRK